MAGIMLHATSGAVAMQTTTRRTILQVLAPQGPPVGRCIIHGWGVAFQGTNVSDAPVLVTVLRQSTAGTGLTSYSAASSPQQFISRKNSLDTETYQTTALVGIGSAEPTAGDFLENFYVQPQLGYRIWFPQGKEIIVPNGTRVGFCITTGALTYNCDFEVDLQE